jgi:hypothetical protein
MGESFLNSGWSTDVVAVSFLCFVLFAFFRLDAHLSARGHRRPPPPGMGIDRKGRLFFTDPDGRPWYPPPRESSNSRGSPTRPGSQGHFEHPSILPPVATDKVLNK